MNRRSVLQLFSSMPVVGPGLARKLAAEETAAGLAKINTSGIGHETGFPDPIDSKAQTQERRLALQIPWVKRELEQLVTERNRNIYRLDPDLACLKSVSLSAKLYYQRQRNIQRDLRNHTTIPPYQQIENLFSKVKKLLG